MGIITSLLLAITLQYGPPVNYPMVLAGNFGEPRPNHFHGGIDISTGNREGKPVFSIANGYVSRVTVGYYGFGNAVYIRHPDGRTSIYCHLKRFSANIERLVNAWRYRNKTNKTDVHLRPHECPVVRGQLIAFSGNTGSSQAPHLHLELHDTRTYAMLDPLDVLKQYFTDTTSPMAHAFMAYPQEGEGVFCGGASRQSFGFPSHNLSREFTAWGKVGFGIWANDYMEGTYHSLGIRNTKLTVDGKIVFEADVDSIPPAMNRMVNSWGDYPHFQRYKTWYMKTFIERGNTLPVLHAARRGIVDFNEERTYNMAFVLTDAFGNQQRYTFKVKGERQKLYGKRHINVMRTLFSGMPNYFHRPGMLLFAPVGTVVGHVQINPVIKRKPDNYSDSYTLSTSPYKLFGNAMLSIKVNKEVNEPEKLYIYCDNGHPAFKGGTYSGGYVTACINELGDTYQIGYDSDGPAIKALSTSGGKLRLNVKDEGSGVESCEAYIDGRFILLHEHPGSTALTCDLSETPLAKTGGTRRLKVVATDKRGNQGTYSADITY